MGCGCNKTVKSPVKVNEDCVPVANNTASGNANNVRKNIPTRVPPIVIPPVDPPPPPECTAPSPIVDVYPPNGAIVQFPIFALLSTDTIGAKIYYTVDGSEPTKDSLLYAGAGIYILDHNQTLRARAFPSDNCPAGPLLEVNWEDVEIENFNFVYLCGESDQTGRFPELDPPGFAPNGNPADSNWRVYFTLAGLTGIKRLEVFQTDGAGNWNTGQAWSTDAYIYPYPKTPAVSFHCYPLVIQSQPGSVLLFEEYQSTLGNYIAADYDWYLYGQQEILPNIGFYQFKMFLEDGRVIHRIIQAICEPPPPPCGKPEDPIITSDCTPKVDISGVTPGPNQVYTIYRRSTGCGENAWVAIIGGTSDGANSYSYQDFAVENCCTYEYYVSVKCPATYFYKASDTVSILVPCQGMIDIDTSKDLICAGDSVILSWVSDHCDSVSIDNGIGVVDVSGTLAVSPVITTTYTITCNNAACGNLTASVTVTVQSGAGCGCVTTAQLSECVIVPDTLIVTWKDSLNVTHSVLLICRQQKYVGGGCDGKRAFGGCNYSLVNESDPQWPNRLELIPVAVGLNKCQFGGYPLDPTATWICALAGSVGATLHSSLSPVGSYTVKTTPALASNVSVS